MPHQPPIAAFASSPRTVRLIGVPMDLGASRRGVDMGPSAIRLAGVTDRLQQLGLIVQDSGNVPIPDLSAVPGDVDARLQVIADVCNTLALWTADAVRDGVCPLILGGDHSLSAGSIAGTVAALAEQQASAGVIWLDAHADLNTPETSRTGNVHGMPVAHLLGYGSPRLAQLASLVPAIRPERMVYVGLRDVDRAERDLIHSLAIRAYTMRDIDERGLRPVMEEALAHLARHAAALHVSCDMDWIDPAEAPGVGTPVPGGATRREAHLAMEIVHDTGRMVAMDVVEINPILDLRNATAELAADLIASAFGRRIL